MGEDPCFLWLIFRRRSMSLPNCWSVTGSLWTVRSTAGLISAERALAYSFSGPNLRAAGVDYDVRVMSPYSSYEEFDFDIPVGTNGDTYDRFIVRQHEMLESMKIIRQALGEGQERTC